MYQYNTNKKSRLSNTTAKVVEYKTFWLDQPMVKDMGLVRQENKIKLADIKESSNNEPVVNTGGLIESEMVDGKVFTSFDSQKRALVKNRSNKRSGRANHGRISVRR